MTSNYLYLNQKFKCFRKLPMDTNLSSPLLPTITEFLYLPKLSSLYCLLPYHCSSSPTVQPPTTCFLSTPTPSPHPYTQPFSLPGLRAKCFYTYHVICCCCF